MENNIDIKQLANSKMQDRLSFLGYRNSNYKENKSDRKTTFPECKGDMKKKNKIKNLIIKFCYTIPIPIRNVCKEQEVRTWLVSKLVH